MSETNDFMNDPRLTAYALGELDGAERAEVEALLAKDDAARRAVEDIRATAALVGAELGNAAGPALTDAQRAAVAKKAGTAKPVFRMRPVYWMATAASVAAVVVGVSLMKGEETKRAPRETATAAWDGQPRASRPAEPRDREMRWKTRTAAALEESKDAEDGLFTTQDEPVTDGSVDVRFEGSNGETTRTDKKMREDLARVADASEITAGENGPVNPNELLLPSVAESDPNAGAPENLPSGATGGTSIGVGRTQHKEGGYRLGGGGGGAGGKRSGGEGKGGGGLGRPAAKPKTDPAAPPEGAGPSTPGGGGPTTGGPADEATIRFAALGYVGGGDHGTTATYAHVEDNPFRLVKDAPLSTFGIDVDTASYSNVRRFLQSGQLPPPGAVRLEEMVNYFPYDYAPPTDGRPFAVRVDVAGCPWKTDHRLVRVGLKGKVVTTAARPAANLVFLLDVSGSMQPENRLPLVIQSMKALVGGLEARDRVAIVVYAGESGVALPSTSCEEKSKILAALESLHAGGSTNGASGIQLAYDIAAQNRIEGGVNRVVLATDGDFNVGLTDQSSLVKLVQEKAKSGTFLSVLGVGDDNYKDSTMEMLADKGNGNYAYIDTLKEGQKALVEQANGTLVTIAKDVKIQVEFNPSQVGSYRLIGYENRVLAAEDFRDDKKDAGEIGAGHTVTALYEVVPPGVLATESVGVEPLKYQQAPAPAGGASRELLTVKLRWKEPNADVSTPMEVPVVDEGLTYSSASPDFKFAASVAAFGMCLRQSPNRGNITLAAVLELATEGAANDRGGWRAEFVTLVKRAVELGAK